MKQIKGAIHIHSLYSYDGEKSIEGIKSIFRDKGVDFIIFTEHAETLGDSEITSFVSECKSVSEENFIIIPGLEFLCENVEILGLGISKRLKFSGLNELIEEIQKNDGLAILPHPYKYKFSLDSASLKQLDGVEVWNYKYDGNAPRIGNINLLKRLDNGSIFAYAGLDFHNDMQNIELYHYLTVEKLNSKEVIKALKAGRFYIKNKMIKLNSKPNIKFHEYLLFGLLNLKYDLLKRCMNIGGKILRYLHIKPPKFLYNIGAKLL